MAIDHEEDKTLRANFTLLAAVAVAVIVLPLTGAVLPGQPAGRFLEFPPTTRYVIHTGFSLPVFMGYSLFGFGVVGGLAVMGFRSLPLPAATGAPW